MPLPTKLAYAFGGAVSFLSLLVLVAVPPIQDRMQGVISECAAEHGDVKFALQGYHWTWMPWPGWVCEFSAIPDRGYDEPFERKL